jgi:hypothetical protein
MDNRSGAVVAAATTWTRSVSGSCGKPALGESYRDAGSAPGDFEGMRFDPKLRRRTLIEMHVVQHWTEELKTRVAATK